MQRMKLVSGVIFPQRSAEYELLLHAKRYKMYRETMQYDSLKNPKFSAKIP